MRSMLESALGNHTEFCMNDKRHGQPRRAARLTGRYWLAPANREPPVAALRVNRLKI